MTRFSLVKRLAAGLAASLFWGNVYAQDSTPISFWVRAADQAFVTPAVKAWNDSHPNKVELTIIPSDNFVTKFGTAMAGGAAPDVVAIDLIFIPAFIQAGQLSDMTAEVKSLGFASALSPAHVRLATRDGKQYAVPFSAESSFLLYNKMLFKKAGLDPNAPPKTMAELEADAEKITALGNGIKGFYFSGACGGCNIFTLTPYIWASGGHLLSPDGKKQTLDNPALRATLTMYRTMWTENLIPRGAATDNGSNFITPFFTGKIGMIGSGAFSIGLLKNQHPEIDFGVAPLPGDKGGAASFAGGDSIAIPSTSKHKKEAWEFIKWVLSDQVQIGQFAKNGSIPVRADFADNAYARQDPRIQLVSALMLKGHAPETIYFNQLFNDPNGPWLQLIQEAVFGPGVDQAIKHAEPRFQQILDGH